MLYVTRPVSPQEQKLNMRAIYIALHLSFLPTFEDRIVNTNRIKSLRKGIAYSYVAKLTMSNEPGSRDDLFI